MTGHRMTPAAIEDCVQRARHPGVPEAGRHAAFEELTRLFEGMAFASAHRWLGDMEEAQEVAQDALLAAWMKLDQLRAPAAFGGWLKKLVATECHRRLRKRPTLTALPENLSTEEWMDRPDPDWSLARALEALSRDERYVTVLFYVHGFRIEEIAALAGTPAATIGKRLYTARLKIRRALPGSVRAAVLRRMPTERPGPEALGGYVGLYRFEKRPDLLVEIRRSPRGDSLVGSAHGQRSLLVPIGADVLATRSFDGEGHFQRDERGRITQFVYYEFGARLGVAKKLIEV